MFRKLDCELQTHQGQEFYGICLNNTCKRSPICCDKCLKEIHIKHGQDVKLKNEIEDYIKQHYNYPNILEIVNQWKSNIINQLKTIEQYIQKEYEIFKLNNEIPNRTKVKQMATKMKSLKTQQEIFAILKNYSFQQEFNTLLNTIKCLDDSFQQMMNDGDEEQQNDLDNSTRKSKSYNDLKNQQQIQFQNWQPQQNDQHVQLVEQGRQLVQQSRFQEALQIFNQILQSNSYNIDALQQIAYIHIWTKCYPQALQVLDILLSQQPENVEGLCQMGFVLYSQFRYKEAKLLYDQALKLQNNNEIARDGAYQCGMKLQQEMFK